ncbi:MAG: dimethylsulfonioproprionate lyase family protein [Hyphomicrobiaceae bacterium]
MRHLAPPVEKLLATLSGGLEKDSSAPSASSAFTRRLKRELDEAAIMANPDAPAPLAPPEEVRSVLQAMCGDEVLQSCILRLTPALSWFSAERFYPEPEHRAFSRNIWGATIIGQEDAPFTASDRFIALLMLIMPDTLYPRHAHRIEELYFVIAGEGEWSHADNEWVHLKAGGTFFNQSSQPHAIRTVGSAALAIGLYLPPFGWEGGLVG